MTQIERESIEAVRARVLEISKRLAAVASEMEEIAALVELSAQQMPGGDSDA